VEEFVRYGQALVYVSSQSERQPDRRDKMCSVNKIDDGPSIDGGLVAAESTTVLFQPSVPPLVIAGLSTWQFCHRSQAPEIAVPPKMDRVTKGSIRCGIPVLVERTYFTIPVRFRNAAFN
jgi:hypothetical protein